MKTQCGVLLLALAGAMFAQERVEKLIEEIETIAAGEPPVIGIDTLLRAGELMLPVRKETGMRLLRDAGSRTLALRDADTRGRFLAEIAGEMAAGSTEEAMALCAQTSGKTLALCFGRVYEHANGWEEQKRAFRTGLAAGGIDDGYVESHLERALSKHKEEAGAEFTAAIEMFPETTATLEEVRRVESWAKRMAAAEPALAASARASAARAAKRLSQSQAKPDEKERAKRKEDDDEKEPETDGLSFSEMIVLARKSAPLDRVVLLMKVIDEDKELPTERRASLAAEALEATPRLKIGDTRLMAQSMLARRLFQYGDRARAAVAAQMLAETFQKRYDCESAACESLGEGDTPGELIYSFAEYLSEHKIRPEELGLSHASLRARMMLIELEEAATGKRHKFGIF